MSIANLCFPARSFPHSESNLTERANQISSFHLHIFETLLLCTWSVIQSNSFHSPPHVSPPLGYSPPLGSSLLSTSIPHSCLPASDSTQNPAPWTNSSSSLSLPRATISPKVTACSFGLSSQIPSLPIQYNAIHLLKAKRCLDFTKAIAVYVCSPRTTVNLKEYLWVL